MTWLELPLVVKAIGWLHEWAGRRLERQRQESEASRERLRQLHAILTTWKETFPQCMAIVGLVKGALDSQRIGPEDFKQLTDMGAAGMHALAKNTPNLPQFIADNSLLLPEDITARLKEIRIMGDLTPIVLGQVNGEAQAETVRRKCDEVMTIIEREFKRGSQKGG